jgi:hypothetical protein
MGAETLTEQVKEKILTGEYVVRTRNYITSVENLIESLQIQVELTESAYPDGINPEEWAEAFLLFVKDELLIFEQ